MGVRSLTLALAGVLLALIGASPAAACDWNKTGSGGTLTWDDPGNWDNCGSTFPSGAGVDASKAVGPGNTIRLTTDIMINDFELLAGALDTSASGALSTLTLGGVFTFGDAAINGSGGGSTNGGSVVANGSAMLDFGVHRLIADTTLVNNGAMTWVGGELNMQGGGSGQANLENGPAGTIDLQADLLMRNGFFVNQGTFTKSAGAGTATISSFIDNMATGIIQVSSGTLLLTQGLAIEKTNAGILRATPALAGVPNVLSFNGFTVKNAGGTISADADSRVEFENTTVDEGTISSVGTGELQSMGGANEFNAFTLPAGSTLALPGQQTRFRGTIINDGLIRASRAGQNTMALEGDNNLATTADDVTFNGTGMIVLDSSGGNARIAAGSSPNERLVNGPTHTITGGGTISPVNRLNVVNQGVIEASDPAVVLNIDVLGQRDDAIAALFNTGTLRATGGATLQIDPSRVDNSGGTLLAEAASTVLIRQSRVDGGTLTSTGDGMLLVPEAASGFGTSILDSVTVSAASNLRIEGRGDRVVFLGTIVNDGTITVDNAGAGSFTAFSIGGDNDLGTVIDDVTLSGGGTLKLEGDNGRAQIVGDSVDQRVINGPSHTIVGPGELGGNALEIVNQGRIEGFLNIGSNVIQQASGTFSIDIRSLTDFDQIDVNNADITLGGTLELAFKGGYAPSAGDSFDLMLLDGGRVVTENSMMLRPLGLDPGAQLTTTFDATTSTYTLDVLNDTSTSPPTLVASVLPASRSVQVGPGKATAFVTIINSGSQNGTSCSIAPTTVVDASFLYQTTDPATNALTGSPDTPVDIAGNGSQSFVIALTPNSPFGPTDMVFDFDCANSDPAPLFPGINTLLLSASATPVPDIIALAATVSNDGIANIKPSTKIGVFTVAVTNLGSADTFDVVAELSDPTLPVAITLCETDPVTSLCVNPDPPAADPVRLTIGELATPTFGFFLQGIGDDVPFDPVNNRIFVRFIDSGGVERGTTSVAVRTFE